MTLTLFALAVGFLAACGASEEGAPSPGLAAVEEEDEEGVVLLTPQQREVAGIQTQVPEMGSTSARVPIQGTVASPDSARIVAGSLVEGRVDRILVLEGDEVEAGSPLVRIHSHELVDWERELAAAQARLAFAREALERGERLLREGAISREERDRRAMEAAVAEADRVRAQDLVNHLNPDDGDVVIQSPRSATVFRILVGPGEVVTPGTPLVELGTVRTLWVVGGLPEGVQSTVTRGSRVPVTFPALPGVEGEGVVVGLGARVDPLLRTVEVRVQLDPIPAGVRPGMMATVGLPAQASVSGLMLPAGAVQRIEGRPHLFVEEGDPGSGRYRAWPVTVLPASDGRVVVTGLPPGLRVVVSGGYALRAMLEGFAGAEEPE